MFWFPTAPLSIESSLRKCNFCFVLFASQRTLWVCAVLGSRGSGRDKIIRSVRFRRARRKIVSRAAKSGAEKAKTLNSKQESVRIPTPFPPYGTYERLISSACFRFFGPDDFSLPERFFDPVCDNSHPLRVQCRPIPRASAAHGRAMHVRRLSCGRARSF